MEELIKHSESWLRRCDEVWFFTGSPLIEHAAGATKLPDLPELYDEAIAVMQWVAGYAQEAERRLKKGRRAAKRKQREAGGTGKAAAEGPTKKKRATKVVAKKQPKKSTQEELKEHFPGAFD